MNDFSQTDPITVSNKRSLNTLTRAIQLSQGEFALILVRCNYVSLGDRVVRQLQQVRGFEIRVLQLSPSVKTLYSAIQAELAESQPQALMVFGLESSTALEQVLTSTNQIREEFRKNFRFPLILWINDEILQTLTRLAPDFKSWAATSIKFDIPTIRLISDLQQTIDAIFKAILELGSGRFLDNASLDQVLGKHHLVEMELAARELQSREPNLEPAFAASLQFLQGRSADAKGEKDKALQYYERSLTVWQQAQTVRTVNSAIYIERQGCLLFYLGLWWRQHAVLHRAEYRESCLKARDYYRECVEGFQQNQRPDLAARFINSWGEVLIRLELFDELEVVARTAVHLHQTYTTPFFLATSYGLLAEVALQKSSWSESEYYAEQALRINTEPFESSINREWDRKYYENWYLLLLAQAKIPLEKPLEAIAHLETAKANAQPQHDPLLYIRILETLRSLYFQQSRYLAAFQIKQAQRSIEQQYGLRAFIGAGRLQPTQHVIHLGLASINQQPSVAEEITASGRQRDIERLLDRITRPDHKLIVIHGQSGVGKSSIVQAGLVPSLKQMMIDTRDIQPILLQIYPDWSETLFRLLNIPSEPPTEVDHLTPLDIVTATIERLRQNETHNLLTVLIFDQFEEFFFVYKDKTERRLFYTFLSQCLNIPFVKVILSLREDYLHYLLDFSRSSSLDIINNNILDKEILYYLGNFSPEDARSVVQSLTERSRLNLEPALINALVQDLAEELGEVRPIELQVVGAQLQAENITTLIQYRQQGPKEKLVERFLEDVIQDCGAENERTARLVLYLLTDENGTRPIKTKTELQTELQTLAQVGIETLDVVLEIFVKSGLVFLLPEFSAERYQLVHDYLVSFIRQQQGAELVRELQQERDSRQRSEAELSRVLRGRFRDAIIVLVFGCLSVFAGVSWLRAEGGRDQAEVSEIAALNSTSEARWLANDQIEALIIAIRAGRKEQASNVSSDLTQQTIERLGQTISHMQEQNRWKGHNGVASDVTFSPDGQILASSGDDGTIQLWNQKGNLPITINAHNEHEGGVWTVSFSPDGQTLASANADGTVKLWTRDGRALRTLQGQHQGDVTSVKFSPDGQTLASASFDGTIKLWRMDDGTLLKTFQTKEALYSVAFSPDGQTLASAGVDGTIKLWNVQGQLLERLQGHRNVASSVSFSPDGQMLASASWDKTVILWARDGRRLATLEGHTNRVQSVNFSKNGQVIASADLDGNILIWSRNGQLLTTLQGREGIRGVDFSVDGMTLATAGLNGTIRLWKDDNFRVQVLQGHGDRVIGVSVSPDGKIIASASADKTIKLWNSDGNLLNTLSGHTDRVTSVRFSPDGKMLASTSADKTIKLWRQDGSLIKTLTGHEASVNGVSFSPDGQRFASVSVDGTVRLWRQDGVLIRIFP
ncbi:MAG TPA: hypothetical protein V6C78_20775, partial [Crinalium sp.]